MLSSNSVSSSKVGYKDWKENLLAGWYIDQKVPVAEKISQTNYQCPDSLQWLNNASISYHLIDNSDLNNRDCGNQGWWKRVSCGDAGLEPFRARTDRDVAIFVKRKWWFSTKHIFSFLTFSSLSHLQSEILNSFWPFAATALLGKIKTCHNLQNFLLSVCMRCDWVTLGRARLTV